MFERLFKFKENGTDLKTEILAGITIFFTMSYILAVCPSILKAAGMPFSGALTATVLVTSISSILMGLFANLPYALAPGMGITAFFTYSMVLGMKIPWETALGAVFISGIIFLLMTIFKLREAIVKAIPQCVIVGVTSGIGFFLCLIALKSVGFIVSKPATIIGFGGFTPQVIVFCIGLFITILLEHRRITGSMLWGIIATTIIAILYGLVFPTKAFITIPEVLSASPDFSSVILKLDIRGALSFGMIGAIFTLLFTDLFDSISTFLGVASVANMVDENGEAKNMRGALMVDAVSTTISGLLGCSSGTTYLESVAGVKQGGRTGLTAIVTGLIFIPFMWFAPVMELLPACAVAPPLLLAGFYMAGIISKIDWQDYETGIPAFFAVLLIPFTFSISQGISWSLITFVALRIFSGKIKEITLGQWLVTLLSCIGLCFY